MAVDRTADLTPELSKPPEPDLTYFQGIISSWDPIAGTNSVNVNGATLTNVPALSTPAVIGLAPNMVVGLLRYKNNYFILGRIIRPGAAEFGGGAMSSASSPFYQRIVDAALQVNTVADYYCKFVAGYQINSPNIAMNCHMQISGAAATGNARVRWYTSYPSAAVAPAGGTLMMTFGAMNQTTAGLTPIMTYTWPMGMIGRLVYVSLEVRLSAGTGGVDTVSAVPAAFYGF